MVEEMFQIIGYHVPPAALSNHARKSGSCQLLDFDLNKVNSLGFNPAVYTRTLDDDDIKKQNLYPRQVKERSSYIPGILDRFTGSDVRVLRKTLEEFYNLKKFSRIFPTRASSKYLNYLNTVSYYDKLLDGFVTRYGENGLDNREEDGTKENGLERIRTACDKNMHL
ncbi:tubulin polyglutamylase TTLL4 [Eurytemora carolleeae]|uniref:tubulin polyglutamylase TTLL4 n=1 Tax=Eurytemora carolleeae TaxID=1294199 RepID=UPI000C78C58C|nr:tubulin polyglutamylase TTLL4 [Eurytemora carolleeae]|eukprot:XP_023329647.1 tubulin polyglutamylase TTLL4-like [Eurytemora affinis]